MRALHERARTVKTGRRVGRRIFGRESSLVRRLTLRAGGGSLVRRLTLRAGGGSLVRRLNLRARVGENLAHRGKIGKLAYNKCYSSSTWTTLSSSRSNRDQTMLLVARIDYVIASVFYHD